MSLTKLFQDPVASLIRLSAICKILCMSDTLGVYSVWDSYIHYRACKMTHATCGGVTHFGLSPDDEDGGIMTVAWGQNAANGPFLHTFTVFYIP